MPMTPDLREFVLTVPIASRVGGVGFQSSQ